MSVGVQGAGRRRIRENKKHVDKNINLGPRRPHGEAVGSDAGDAPAADAEVVKECSEELPDLRHVKGNALNNTLGFNSYVRIDLGPR